ncbi:MAG: glycosyltransferase [Treponema sp.]|nr:glycosyltransferase [Treponema sp.]MDY5764389.1 glycosyltransferase [Treponema sp.]
MKVAIVHDWLTNYGGAETFVELLLKIYPDAHIFTLVYDKKKMKSHFENNKIITSSLQKIPFSTKLYTKLLKFMPKAFESFDFSNYDLVLCSSSSCAKGVIVPPYIPQVAYIHSPMRYAWDLYFDYKKRSGRITRFFMEKWMSGLRQWDYISSQRIDCVLANSKYISRRIKKFWNLDSKVVYSPVNTKRFFPDFSVKKEDFYVAFSRLVPYKRIDLAISAIKNTGRKLIVIGSGSEEKKLKKLAQGDENIIFTGRLPDKDLRKYLQSAKAMIFCAEEDFGLAPLEAQQCGTAVIAFGRGGAVETIINEKTGVFFDKQETESLKNAIEKFEKLYGENHFISEEITEHAKTFSEERFIKEFTQAVEETKQKIAIKN